MGDVLLREPIARSACTGNCPQHGARRGQVHPTRGHQPKELEQESTLGHVRPLHGVAPPAALKPVLDESTLCMHPASLNHLCASARISRQ
jgi:hypothetical protein